MKEPDFQFENEWRTTFSKVEVMPSRQLWDKIELELDRKEAGKDKRSYFIWQMVAAVSLLLAASALLFNYFQKYNRNQQLTGSRGQQETVEKHPETQKGPPAITEESGRGEKKIQDVVPDHFARSNSVEESSGDKISNPDTPLANNSSSLNENINTQDNISDQLLERVGGVKLRKVWLPRPDVHKVAYSKIQPEETSSFAVEYPVWAGIKVAGGASSSEESSLSPIMKSLRSETADFSQGPANIPQPVQNSSKTGFGYSLGFAFGKQLTKRVYVQSGLQYLVQNTEGSTNAYFLNLQTQQKEPIFVFNTDKELYSESGAPIRQIEYYPTQKSLTSSLEYFSIPLQVGYLIVDRKIDWGLAAGFSTDFFIRNLISDKSGEIDGYITRNSDEESPFRPVSLSAIFSTELNYNLTDNYSVSLEPRYSVGLNPITREEVQVDERRLKSLTVGIKLRYIF